MYFHCWTSIFIKILGQTSNGNWLVLFRVTLAASVVSYVERSFVNIDPMISSSIIIGPIVLISNVEKFVFDFECSSKLFLSTTVMA
jgi:hypothetical protein